MQFDPKKLGEEADEMIAQLNRGEAEEAEVADEDQASDAEEAITETAEEAEDDQGTGVSEVVDKPEVESGNEELALLRKQVEASEQRWKVLQGMINKKDEEIEAMRTLLAEMHAQPQQASQSESPKQQVSKLITDSDVAEYGEDLIDLVTRASTQASANLVQETVGKLLERISHLENSLKGVEKKSAEVAENSFFTELGKLVPNYAELNTDPNFLGWLNTVDPFTGATKLSLLQDAQAKGDYRRVATFFNTFINESAPRNEEPVANTSAKDKLVTPGKAKQATPRQDEKRTWTRAEIAKLYDDKMAGRISAKKFDELERDIFAAQLEGRVAS